MGHVADLNGILEVSESVSFDQRQESVSSSVLRHESALSLFWLTRALPLIFHQY